MSETESTQMKTQAVYVNDFAATSSSEEFCVTLRVRTPTGTQPLFEVLMSPEGAKTLLKLLEYQIKIYEETVRKLREPEIAPMNGKVVRSDKEIYH